MIRAKTYPTPVPKFIFTSFCSEFMKGQQECIDGIPHVHVNDARTRGYSAEYTKQQNEEWESGR